MKTRLKVGALLCAIAMGLSLTSCTKASAAELFDQANQKSQESFDTHGIDMTMNMDMKVSLSGQEQNVKMNMDLKASGGEEKNKLSGVMKMELLGQSVDTLMYADGTNLYMTAAGVTQKQALTSENTQQLDQYSNMMGKMKLGDIKPKVQKVEKKDGKQTLTIELGGNQLTDSMKELMNQMTEGLGTSDVNYKFDTMNITAELDQKGNLLSETVEVKAAVSAQEQTMEMEMKIDLILHSIGKDIQVEVPEGMDIENAIDATGGSSVTQN